ncbi:hypothetical protein SCHPADRAFT_713139 [Schizopora paradoxa]|uniref:Uncharacterized protein n=1 Tax=Schizopora paradoxa TaxID=27342 RepID=A0A0H2R1Z4_9AGAM|nr:hypothetical protein SCHPADRAFT_713139 [Schizopora paradoxa]
MLASFGDEASHIHSRKTTSMQLWMSQPTFRGTCGIFSLAPVLWSKRSSTTQSSFMGFPGWFQLSFQVLCPEVFLVIALIQRANVYTVLEQAKKFPFVRMSSAFNNSNCKEE